MIADVLAAVVVAQPQARGDVLGDSAEALADALADGLEGFEAFGRPGSMHTDTLDRAMVDGDEHGGPQYR